MRFDKSVRTYVPTLLRLWVMGGAYEGALHLSEKLILGIIPVVLLVD